MKLFLSVATIILLAALGTIPFQDAKSGASSQTAELDSTGAANSVALSGFLVIQAELSDLVNDLAWVIYENDIHYDFRLRMGEEISALQRELEEKVNTLAGLFANFVPVINRVDNAKRLVEEFAERDELAYYADKAYDRARDMRRAVEILIQELQAISDDLAQTPAAQEGDENGS